MLSELGEIINKYRENFNKELEKNIYIYIKDKVRTEEYKNRNEKHNKRLNSRLGDTQ